MVETAVQTRPISEPSKGKRLEPDISWAREAQAIFDHAGKALEEPHSKQEAIAIGHIRFSLWLDLHPSEVK